MNIFIKKYFLKAILVVFVITLAGIVYAGVPAGDDTFQLLTNVTTGNDNTGDGGTGNPSDLNYYYVGQTFTTNMEIKSAGTTAANIWVEYPSDTVTASNLQDGSYFNVWSGQVILPTDVSPTQGRIYQTGSNIPVVQSTGTGNFGSIQWTADKPTAAAYSTGTPITLDINTGTIGNTTESNISLNGVDLLDDEEDFQFHIWADTVKPYAFSPNPTDGQTNVSITTNYTFDLCDSKDGEIADAGACLASGVGTGVNTGVGTFQAVPVPTATTITLANASSSYSCSGLWGSDCDATMSPSYTAISGIPGDTRKWEYGTTYTVTIDDYRDYASPSQNQLGDANGPNTMDQKVYTFSTEADTVPPQVTAEIPVRGSGGVSVSTNVTVEIEDRKTYPNGPSGTGVDVATCNIQISSPSFTATNYTQGDSGVTTTSIPYGYRFVIDPATDFAQNETVTVTVSDCQDFAVSPNVMAVDIYTFSTADTEPPYVQSMTPNDDGQIGVSGNIEVVVNDDGTGVDINELVVFVEDEYFTLSGGAGTVTTNGTVISFDNSTAFAATGTPASYTLVIDPTNDFTLGEAVPIVVYAEDLASPANYMPRAVYALTVPDPTQITQCSNVCGDGTSWDGAQCIADEVICTDDRPRIRRVVETKEIEVPVPVIQEVVREVIVERPVYITVDGIQKVAEAPLNITHVNEISVNEIESSSQVVHSTNDKRLIYLFMPDILRKNITVHGLGPKNSELRLQVFKNNFSE